MSNSDQYGTFWRRVGAGFIDGIIFYPVEWIDTWVWSSKPNPEILVPWYIVNSVSFLIYSVMLHGLFGQTLGKRVMGVIVLDQSGSKLTMLQAILRDSIYLANIVFLLLITVPIVASGVNPYDTLESGSTGKDMLVILYFSAIWFFLEVCTMLTNRKRRALHDFIAGSVVINH